LEPGLSNLIKTGKSSNLSVSKVFETSKKDLEDLFQDFYDEYFDSSKIIKTSTTNVETAINEEVFHEVKAITTACFTQNRLIIQKHFDKTPYELMNKRKPNIKFFRVLGCRCYLLNDYEDVGKLKENEDIGVFVGYSKESAAFRIYNKRTQTSKKDLEDLFQNFYDEYFDSSKIMKSSTMNVETSNVEVPSHEEEVFMRVPNHFKRNLLHLL
nr:copia protein [Tanacetum cinerariifolium]